MPKETFLRLRDDKRERLLRAAVHEFVTHGFERAKIASIAARAGVAKGSLYQYFEDKKELFVYCAEWGLGVVMDKIKFQSGQREMDIFEYFQESASKNQVIREERELALFMQRIESEPSLARETLARMYETSNAYIRRIIEVSQERGLVRTDMDIALLMEFFIGVTEHFEQRWMQRYIDFSKDMDEANNAAMQQELRCMLLLLKNGMGC